MFSDLPTYSCFVLLIVCLSSCLSVCLYACISVCLYKAYSDVSFDGSAIYFNHMAGVRGFGEIFRKIFCETIRKKYVSIHYSIFIFLSYIITFSYTTFPAFPVAYANPQVTLAISVSIASLFAGSISVLLGCPRWAISLSCKRIYWFHTGANNIIMLVS